MRSCPTCKSTGFSISRLGQDRCFFCDGTEGGNPPTEEEVERLLRLDLVFYGSSFAQEILHDGKLIKFRLLPSSVFLQEPSDAN